MKRTGVCPKCGSGRIGYFEELIYYDKEAFLLHERRLKLGATDGGKAAEIESYVCVDCGHLELAVLEPEKVPFTELEGFRWRERDPAK